MRRILVLGSSGSGKSTLAKRLGEQLGLETIHLDSHFWQPNWTSTPPEEWKRKVSRLLQKEFWVMDGNYPSLLAKRLERADTMIFLDYPRLTCLWRCIKRFIRYWGENRPELAPGCYEKIDWDFLRWIWNYPRDIRPQMLAALEHLTAGKKGIILQNDREVTAFLRTIKGSQWQQESST